MPAFVPSEYEAATVAQMKYGVREMSRVLRVKLGMWQGLMNHFIFFFELDNNWKHKTASW